MQVRKQIKDESYSAADFFVGVENDPARGVIEESGRETKAQFALFGFGQFAAQQPLAQPMKFGFAHCALESE